MALTVNEFGKVRYAAETSAQVQNWMNRNLRWFALTHFRSVGAAVLYGIVSRDTIRRTRVRHCART